MPDTENNKENKPAEMQDNSDSGANIQRRRRHIAAQQSDTPAQETQIPDPNSLSKGNSATLPEQPMAKPTPGITRRRTEIPTEPASQEASNKTTSSNTKTAEQSDEEGARKKRIILLIVTIGVVAWIGMMIAMSDNEGGSQAFTATGNDLSVPPAIAIDQKPGNEKAKELNSLIESGKYTEVAQNAAKLRSEFSKNTAAIKATYRAEAVKAVVDLGAKLDSLPSPELKNADLHIQTNIDRIFNRIPFLAILAEYRRDWGQSLMTLDEANKIYEKFDNEIATAQDTLTKWERGKKLIEEARKAIVNSPSSDLSRCVDKLNEAAALLELPQIAMASMEVNGILQAEKQLAARQLKAAVSNLDSAQTLEKADLRTDTKNAPTMLLSIRLEAKKRYKEARQHLGSWAQLNTALEFSQLSHADGKTAEAIKAIKAVLPKSDPKNKLTIGLTQQLKSDLTHYETTIKSWEKAKSLKGKGTLKEQLDQWQLFYASLQKVDSYYKVETRKEMIEIKNLVRAKIGREYAKLNEESKKFRKITARMRKPESPRGPFEEQAKILLAMAQFADEIKKTAAVLPKGWQLGGDAQDQFDYALSVLNDHNDQARRLWNLSQLYLKRGLLKESRECMERVVILGNVSSNNWYAEAVKRLKENK